MNLTTLKSNLGMNFHRANLVLQKHSPEILLVSGVVGVVSSIVLSSIAGSKAIKQIECAKEYIANLEEGEYKLEKTRQTIFELMVDLSRIYAPTAIIGAVSIAALVGSHNILSSRNAALAAAYALIDEAYKKYRARVIEEFGEDVDRYIREMKPMDDVKIVKGKKDFSLKDAEKSENPLLPSIYARVYDSSSSQWREGDDLNLVFLRTIEAYLNDLLQARGHVFLNEVYDGLDIPRSREGAIVGWLKDSPNGDGYISLGIFENGTAEFNGDVNVYGTHAIMINPNVDGSIFDLI